MYRLIQTWHAQVLENDIGLYRVHHYTKYKHTQDISLYWVLPDRYIHFRTRYKDYGIPSWSQWCI